MNTENPDGSTPGGNPEGVGASGDAGAGEGTGTQPEEIGPVGESQSNMTATRREFLSKVGLALGGLSGVVLVGPVLGFLLAPLFRKPPEIWRSVGAVSDFKVGETVEVTFE